MMGRLKLESSPRAFLVETRRDAARLSWVKLLARPGLIATIRHT